jgi:hypothetical protein
MRRLMPGAEGVLWSVTHGLVKSTTTMVPNVLSSLAPYDLPGFTMYTSEVLKRTCFQHSTRILWKLAHRTFWYWKPIQLLLGISSEESSYHYYLQRLRGKM